jgi:hypothetical protein
MSKLLKAESARINGAKSKGPVTPEGKARSSQNAVRHALAARSIPLTNEDQDHCLEMLEDYFDYLEPVGIVEKDLVEEMVEAKWRQRRAIAMYNAAIDLRMQEDEPAVAKKFLEIDTEIRQVVAVRGITKDDPNLLQTFHRYEVSARRAYHKALRTLLELQALRKTEEKESQPDPPRQPKQSPQPPRPQLVKVLRNEPTVAPVKGKKEDKN